MTLPKYRLINLQSQHRPVDIVGCTYNPCTSNYDHIMSNGAIFRLDRGLIRLRNPHFDEERISTEVIYRYMRSCGYEWSYAGDGSWSRKESAFDAGMKAAYSEVIRESYASPLFNAEPGSVNEFRPASSMSPQIKEQTSMLKEFRAYLSEHSSTHHQE